MAKCSSLKVYLTQFILLLVVFQLGWHLLHRTPQVSKEAHAYLLGLPSELIILAQIESQSLNAETWADLIAIRSTLSLNVTDTIIYQIRQNTPLNKIIWGNLNLKTIKVIMKRKQILMEYPYYEPGRFTFPISGSTWYVDTFGAGREGGRRSHEGTDLFSPEGTPIISVCEGIIEKAGWNRLGGERVGVRGFDGNYYYYAHLKDIAPTIKVGRQIQKGEILGTMGHTGDALTTPDHLHFGIELPNGTWINPYQFLKIWEKERSILKF